MLHATLKNALILLLVTGCATQSVISEVSPELQEKITEEGERAKNNLDNHRKSPIVSEKAKRILAEANEANANGDKKKYLAKIQKYRELVNHKPIKRAAEAKELEGQVLFSQLRLKEAQQAIEEAVKLDSSNPEYLLILADYLRWNGSYQRSEKVALKAVNLIENQESVDELSLSEAHSYLGFAYLYSKKYDLADISLQQSLEMKKKLLPTNHPLIAIDLKNLAKSYESQSRYEEAESLHKKALEINLNLVTKKSWNWREYL